MTPEKTKQVLAKFKEILNVPAVKLPPESYTARMVATFEAWSATPDAMHAAWMCDEASRFVDEGHMEKAMRWLGWINHVLYTRGYMSLDEIKDACKPDEA